MTPTPTAPTLDSMVDRAVYTVKEVAELLGLSEKAIRDMIKRGDIPSFRLGRSVFVPKEKMDAIVRGDVAEEGER